jgi:hypothetical protein
MAAFVGCLQKFLLLHPLFASPEPLLGLSCLVGGKGLETTAFLPWGVYFSLVAVVLPLAHSLRRCFFSSFSAKTRKKNYFTPSSTSPPFVSGVSQFFGFTKSHKLLPFALNDTQKGVVSEPNLKPLHTLPFNLHSLKHWLV